jgi:excisionase family DNA binding protein
MFTRRAKLSFTFYLFGAISLGMSGTLLTTSRAAERLGVGKSTVNLWCRQGRFPNAESTDTPRGPVWLIPESDLEGFEPPKMGRPSKSKEEAEKSVAKKRVRKKDPTRLLKTLS